MPSFGGWNIISMPTDPAAPKSIEWQLSDVIGSNRSPFTLQQQVYDWGQAILRASLSYQPMLPPQSAAWEAFLMNCQGINNVFLFGDPLRLAPINAGATGGTVTGSGQTGGRVGDDLVPRAFDCRDKVTRRLRPSEIFIVLPQGANLSGRPGREDDQRRGEEPGSTSVWSAAVARPSIRAMLSRSSRMISSPDTNSPASASASLSASAASSSALLGKGGFQSAGCLWRGVSSMRPKIGL